MTTVSFQKNVSPTRLPAGLIQAAQILTGSTDAIKLFAGYVFIASTGVDATTLAQPIAGSADSQPNGLDSLDITIMDVGGHAHTVTTISTPISESFLLTT